MLDENDESLNRNEYVDSKSVIFTAARTDNWQQIRYASGRTALFAILSVVSKIQSGGVAIPNYVCDSVTKTVIDAGLSYYFYGIDETLQPNINSIIKACQGRQFSAIVLIDYFGCTDIKNAAARIRKEFPDTLLVLDDVQNYYGFTNDVNNIDYDFSFTSLRKWFPVPDGAIVRCRNQELVKLLPEYDFTGRFQEYKTAGNLLKSFKPFINDDLCLELIGKGEELLDNDYLGCASDIGKLLLEKIDTVTVAKRRKANAAVLHDGLNRLGIRHIFNPDSVQLFVPIFLDSVKRNQVRRAMFQNNIFCPIHWPYVSDEINGINELYDTELSLICDQRYDEDNMREILNIFEHECNDN